tara:strand:+ start:1926 stop:2981 length:1056 start_codon:yes stop_codon:yes gene_type:complete
MKLCFVIGTRPEIIKVYPLLYYCKKNNIDYDLVHSNQHYSTNMDKVFFDDLNINVPDYNLKINNSSESTQITDVIKGCNDIFNKKQYNYVIVQGDTNTVLGAALAANKNKIKLCHVEAGLRSYDKNMPEEINRRIVDHISDFCFCPTKNSVQNLLEENISNSIIFNVGNTIVDSLALSKNKYSKIKVNEDEYALVTLHRPSNVDNKKKLSLIFQSLNSLKEELNLKIILPVHPRTKKNLKKFNINFNNVSLIDPLPYYEFLAHIKNSHLVITDSGGIQEEACILNIPCVTIRENTERPETISVGSNILSGLNKSEIINSCKIMLAKKSWINPFGDGNSSKKIIKILLSDNE